MVAVEVEANSVSSSVTVPDTLRGVSFIHGRGRDDLDMEMGIIRSWYFQLSLFLIPFKTVSLQHFQKMSGWSANLSIHVYVLAWCVIIFWKISMIKAWFIMDYLCCFF